MTSLTVTEYPCHKRPRICSVCRNHNPVLSSIITYHLVCNKNKTTGVTTGKGTVYPSGAPEFTPGFKWGSCCSIADHCLCFCLFSLYCMSFDIRLLLPVWYLHLNYPRSEYTTIFCFLFYLYQSINIHSTINQVINQSYFLVVGGNVDHHCLHHNWCTENVKHILSYLISLFLYNARWWFIDILYNPDRS